MISKNLRSITLGNPSHEGHVRWQLPESFGGETLSVVCPYVDRRCTRTCARFSVAKFTEEGSDDEVMAVYCGEHQFGEVVEGQVIEERLL